MEVLADEYLQLPREHTFCYPRVTLPTMKFVEGGDFGKLFSWHPAAIAASPVYACSCIVY